jgi:hypothetical protein
MNCIEAATARKCGQPGAQVLLDEELELVGPAQALFLKA